MAAAFRPTSDIIRSLRRAAGQLRSSGRYGVRGAGQSWLSRGDAVLVYMYSAGVLAATW